jgi:hypothetical protein
MLKYKTQIEADFESSKWDLIADLIEKDGGDKYTGAVIKQRFRNLVEGGLQSTTAGNGDGNADAGVGSSAGGSGGAGGGGRAGSISSSMDTMDRELGGVEVDNDDGNDSLEDLDRELVDFDDDDDHNKDNGDDNDDENENDADIDSTLLDDETGDFDLSTTIRPIQNENENERAARAFQESEDYDNGYGYDHEYQKDGGHDETDADGATIDNEPAGGHLV